MNYWSKVTPSPEIIFHDILYIRFVTHKERKMNYVQFLNVTYLDFDLTL